MNVIRNYKYKHNKKSPPRLISVATLPCELDNGHVGAYYKAQIHTENCN